MSKSSTNTPKVTKNNDEIFWKWLRSIPTGKREKVTCLVPITLPMDKWSHVAQRAIEEGITVGDVISWSLYCGEDIIDGNWDNVEDYMQPITPNNESKKVKLPLYGIIVRALQQKKNSTLDTPHARNGKHKKADTVNQN